MRRATQQVIELLGRYSEMGKTVSECVPLLGRKAETLKRHAKANSIDFIDYSPRN